MYRRLRPHCSRVPVFLVAASFLAALALSGCSSAYEDEGYYQDSSADEEPAPSDEFEDLIYWGQWFELSPYGQVWRPTVVMGWRPYANGQWIWTVSGWTWLSYEPFGWATYHYGTWAYDFAWGWIWVPGYEWHPACVQWIIYDDYVAWAPLPPPGFSVYDPWTESDYDCWHVVQTEHFADSDVSRYYVKYKDRAQLKDRSEVKYRAPEEAAIEKYTRSPLEPVKVELVKAFRDRSVEKMMLPPEDAQRIAPYKERVEKELRTAETAPGGVREDRLRPANPPGAIGPERSVTNEKSQEAKPAEPTKRKSVRKKSSKREPAKKEPEQKQPEKKDPEQKQPTKKEAAKKTPEKKTSDKTPEKKDPEKKPPRDR
jgi:hypothetical protein